MTDLSSADTSSALSKLTTDGTGNLSSDITTADPTTTATVTTDHDDTVIEASSIIDESTEPNYRSSLSFVDLVETIFMKKDSKPVPTSMKEESVDTEPISEEIPLLSTPDKPESETRINTNSEEMTSTVD
jgi:hypothetical protein